MSQRRARKSPEQKITEGIEMLRGERSLPSMADIRGEADSAPMRMFAPPLYMLVWCRGDQGWPVLLIRWAGPGLVLDFSREEARQSIAVLRTYPVDIEDDMLTGVGIADISTWEEYETLRRRYPHTVGFYHNLQLVGQGMQRCMLWEGQQTVVPGYG